jgi:hypothetical protein
MMNSSDLTAGGRIFISYRREESRHFVGRLGDWLINYFGTDQVFRDVDTIEPGADFIEAIYDAVGSCEVLLAVIGDQWLTVTDKKGRRRLDNPDDVVRLEIEAALDRDVRVIPVLVDGVAMPSSEDLPESMVKLARRNASEVTYNRFRYDAEQLAKVIERAFSSGSARRLSSERDTSVATEPAGPQQQAELKVWIEKDLSNPRNWVRVVVENVGRGLARSVNIRFERSQLHGRATIPRVPSTLQGQELGPGERKVYSLEWNFNEYFRNPLWDAVIRWIDDTGPKERTEKSLDFSW